MHFLRASGQVGVPPLPLHDALQLLPASAVAARARPDLASRWPGRSCLLGTVRSLPDLHQPHGAYVTRAARTNAAVEYATRQLSSPRRLSPTHSPPLRPATSLSPGAKWTEATAIPGLTWLGAGANVLVTYGDHQRTAC